MRARGITQTTSRFIRPRQWQQPRAPSGGTPYETSMPLSFVHFLNFSSTVPSNDDLTTNHNNEAVEVALRGIRAWAKDGQGKKAEEALQRLLESNKDGNLTNQELQTGYNLVLFAWSNSRDVDSAQRATQLLKSMPVEPTVLSYRYLLKCWSQVKKTRKPTAGDEAERCLRKLQALGVRDLWSAYHLALKACTKTGDGTRATRLLLEMSRQKRPETTDDRPLKTMVSKSIISTVLMAMKSHPERAETLLDNLETNLGMKPDEVHYCTVLQAWAAARNGPRAESLIQKMTARGVKLDVGAFRALLYAWRDDIHRQEQLFRAMIDDYLNCPYRNNAANFVPGRPAVQPDVQSLSIVLSALAKGDAPERAEALLHWIATDPEIGAFLRPNVVCYTSVIHAWARAKQPQRAEALLRHILQSGQDPNVITYTTVMHAWACVGDVERAKAWWDEMVHHQKIGPNHYTLNTLVLAYVNANRPEGAQTVLEQAAREFDIVPGVASYCTLMRAWARSNQPHKARELLDELRRREVAENVVLLDLIAYNTVIQAYTKAGMPEEAEALLLEMVDSKNRVRPDVQSFTQVLSAYTKSKDPKHIQMAGVRAESLLQQMQAAGIVPNSIAFNVFLHCFATCGLPQKAEAIFYSMLQATSIEVDVVALNTCLNAWARVGNAERAEQLLTRIGSDPNIHNRGGNQIRPDKWSFSIVLAAWARQGSVADAEHAEAILRHMITLDRTCKPDTVAYNTVLAAWLNVAVKERREDVAMACAERAEQFLSEMERKHNDDGLQAVRPDKISYSTVSRIWAMGGNKERADVLMKRFHRIS